MQHDAAAPSMRIFAQEGGRGVLEPVSQSGGEEGQQRNSDCARGWSMALQ